MNTTERVSLREMCELIGIDDCPLECAFAIAGLLRSTLQGEPSTLEGECATLVKATELLGRMDDPATIRKWLDRLGFVAEIPVPGSWWMAIGEADKEEDYKSMDVRCVFKEACLELKGQPIGMLHCPFCGVMVIAGVDPSSLCELEAIDDDCSA